MDSKEIEQQLSEVRSRLTNEDGIAVFSATNQPFEGFVVEAESLTEFAETGLELGATEFYILEDRTEEDEVVLGGLCFFCGERPHTVYLKSDQWDMMAEEADSEAGRRTIGFERTESEEERQRKKEIAEELLSEYEEYLSEDEQFELENRLDHMRLRRLITLQDRIEEEAKADPEQEKRLARAVYNDDRFNRQFNETDTEMLLDDLDIEFDPEKIRTTEVHRRAKSLLKINR